MHRGRESRLLLRTHNPLPQQKIICTDRQACLLGMALHSRSLDTAVEGLVLAVVKDFQHEKRVATSSLCPARRRKLRGGIELAS